MAGGAERALRRRIRSVQATRKITRAFELIAASQIVRAQNRIIANRPYRAGMARIVLEAAKADSATAERLLVTPEQPERVAVVCIVGDRGLSGPYNSSVLRATERLVAEHRLAGTEVTLVTVGRKALSYFRFRDRPVLRGFTGMADRPTFTDARRVAAALWRLFDQGEVQLVRLVSTRYRSAGTQVVEVRQLLPLPDPGGRITYTDTGLSVAPHPEGAPGAGYTEFEPDPKILLDALVVRALESELFSALLEASASEHASRQRAMAAATENADELARTLSRVMNRARQDAITTEIMEIVGGAEALRAAKGA
jgi:F-type H+-transporting ATPase subunit gamma